MKRIYPLLTALLFLAPGFAADEVKQWNIRIELQIVAIPDEIAVPLAAELMDEQKIEPAYAKIQELLAKGTAKLIGWPIVTTHSGEKASVEAVDEIRYATGVRPAHRQLHARRERKRRGENKSAGRCDIVRGHPGVV